MMKRREFITLLGGAAATWPLALRAQQPAMTVIGFLNSSSQQLQADRVRDFQQGLRETGFVEGRNVAIEYRWADGHYDQLPALAADLVRRQVAVIAATGASPSGLTAKAATATIPIVFQMGADPVALGLVASLNRPGGNLTGAVSMNGELIPKLLELMHEMVPATAGIGLLINPTNPVWVTGPSQIALSILQAQARSFGVQLHVLHAGSERDFDAVFETLAERQAGGLVIAADPLFTDRNQQVAALSFRHGVPTIYSNRGFAVAGGLMGYGANPGDPYRLVGVYTGRILKGEKPGDLPVQQSTKVELIINLKTAKALGLTVPLSLLTRADEVIE
jgi:putative ABC transport system substrate-binding protein